jgi:hypothetical protein
MHYIKSREELIGEIIGLLQSPARVISALQNQFAEKRLLKKGHNKKEFSSIIIIYNAHNKQNIIYKSF